MQVREGDEYKLLLNMQNYRPENITVKLSDERELSITALAGDKSEDFCQRNEPTSAMLLKCHVEF